MADENTITKSVLLTGIDELSPKLKALVSKVDSFKNNLERAGLGKLDISGLFKGGSVITPFVEGIKASDAFKGKLAEVGEAAKGVDMPNAPQSAAQSMNVFSDSMSKVSASIDAALAPAVGALVVGLEPLLTGVGRLVADNPKLVETLATAAIAFSAMQTAVTGATQVFDLMSSVLKVNPIMLIAMGVALAAGLIIANWTPISAFFVNLWGGIKNFAASAMAVLRKVFSWTPLGMVIANWGPITGFFSGIWEGIKAVTLTVVGYLKTAFSWTPYGMIIDNWAGLTGLFSAIWELLKVLTVPVIDFLKGLFDWTPLGMIINNWGAITGFFSSIWTALQPAAQVIKDFFGTLFDYSPLGMIINNWGAITGFFSSIWTALQPAAQVIKDFFGTLFDYSPLGMIINNWGAISAFFDPLWAALQASAQVVKDFFSGVFEWSPMTQIAANWQPISEVFSALWGVLQALAAPVLDFLHGMFEWTPLGQIIKNWGPITEWFGELWQKLQTVIAPIKALFDGGFAGLVAKVTGKVEGLTEAQRQTNAEGKGELAPTFFSASPTPAANGALQGGSLTQNSSALIQQSAANNRTQLEGGLTVRFENAPAGLRTDQPQTNQGWRFLRASAIARSLQEAPMNWRDRLLPASFRGVGFWIDQAKTPVGRKGQLHEYPQRDLPFFEDLGQQAKTHDLTAFIVGPDCLEQRDKLLKALEQGSGELVHPWLGRLQVKVGECDMTHTRQDGGLVTFALKFYPDQPLPFPTATVSTQKVLLAKADTLLGAAVARFEQAMTLIKAARIGIANLRNSLTGVYEVIKEQLKPLIEQYRQVTELVKAVKELPKEVAAQFKGLLGDIKSLKAFAKEGYRGVIADVSQQLEDIRKADAPKLTTGKDTTAAAQAVADLVQDTLLVKVAQFVASMPVATKPVKTPSTPSLEQQATQPVNRDEVPVINDLQVLQKALAAAINPMLDKAGPAHYQAIDDVKQALIAHLKAVASSGVRQVNKSFQDSLPALVVAYKQFADATRVDEVTQSNGIAHPGFLPNAVKVSGE